MEKTFTLYERCAQNLFSFWFPKIEKSGIPTPKSIIIPVPDNIIDCFYLENWDKDMAKIRAFVEDSVIPRMKEENLHYLPFIKNGTFSGKFNAASSCLLSAGDVYGIADAIAHINYDALCCGAGGLSEVVIRERIPYDARVTPCIYRGLPLRPEFRVFYDFDESRVLFTVNYWDYDYIRRNPHDKLYSMTDKIIFDHERSKLESAFEKNKARVESVVTDAMKSVQGLDGSWSIDLLMDEKGILWLIDMAVAEQSAYWEWRNGKRLISPQNAHQ